MTAEPQTHDGDRDLEREVNDVIGRHHPDFATLRRELIGAFAMVFAGALFVAIVGVVLLVPRLTPGYAAAYVVLLLLLDVAEVGELLA